MKKFTRKIGTTLLMVFVLVNVIKAQNWRLGGNPDFGGNGLLTNSNLFGATGSSNVRLATGGISRIFIGGTSYTFPGFIGIGTENPQTFTHFHNPATGLFQSSFTQWTNPSTTAGSNRGLLIGNFGPTALISQAESSEMIFSTAGSSRVAVKGTPGFNQEFVAIGGEKNLKLS